MNDRGFLPELEGIRGYAFLAVFLVHYTSGLVVIPTGSGLWRHLWFYCTQITWVAVPIFFVLSGYLITGILFDTLDRPGYFKVFYARRALRILPAYYACLLLVATVALITHAPLRWEHIQFLFYVQNTLNAGTQYFIGQNMALGHLWSLAVEAQFYLVWPVVLWLVRDRIVLLRICYGGVVAACLLRIVWPFTDLGPYFAYSNTFTRGDALLLGAALALHSRAPGFDIQRIARPARWLTVAAVCLFYAKVFLTGNGIPLDSIGVSVLLSLINFLALGLVMLCLIPGGLVQRLCRARWACAIGTISYGLYMYHYLFEPLIQEQWAPTLADSIGQTRARLCILTGVSAFTFALALLSYRFVERPALRLKNRIHYGPQTEAPAPVAAAVETTDNAM